MSTCKTCGSPSEIIDDGREVVTHYLGCFEAKREHAHSLVEPDFSNSQCEFGDCHNPKYSDHPRVKFCEDHKDPKNRKE